MTAKNLVTIAAMKQVIDNLRVQELALRSIEQPYLAAKIVATIQAIEIKIEQVRRHVPPPSLG